MYTWDDNRACTLLLSIDKEAIVDVWDQGTPNIWKLTAAQIAGTDWQRISISSGCYNIEYDTWQSNYLCDPQVFKYAGYKLRLDDYHKIVGGHATRWGEHANAENWFNKSYPGLSAVGEKLWSPVSFTCLNASSCDGAPLDSVTPRLQRVTCRLIRVHAGIGPFDTEWGDWPLDFCDDY